MADTLWQRLTTGVRRLRQRADWVEFVGADWADHILDVSVTDRFHAKQGRSTGRWIVHATGRRLGVYLKRHYRLEWWRGVVATIFPRAGWTPAFQEWDNLAWARAEGFPVPEAVAAAEYIGPHGRLQSVLVVAELTDMLPLHEAIPIAERFLDAAQFAHWKRGLCLEIARLVTGLHGRCRFHKDLYLCHLYVAVADLSRVPEAWPGRVFLIDLHRLSHHRLDWRIWQVKDLAQLLYSTAVAGVTARDRLRFWRVYLGPKRRTATNRWLRWFILGKWRRYQRHNDRRRTAGRAPGERRPAA